MYDLEQLRALAAAAELGSLEAAAAKLHVTPSAVSQRLKALERSAGAVLLRRTRPASPTEAGEPLVRLARQIEALSDEVVATRTRPRVTLAVNGDSLTTWVLPALAPVAARTAIEFRREDQDRSAELLRDGSAMAAITAQAAPVQGCTSSRLGVMRYRPLASPAFVERWFPHGPTTSALEAAPVVVFDRTDQLQDRFLAGRGADPAAPPRHLVPATAEFGEAVRLGYGWGMLPDQQAAGWRASGELVLLQTRARIDVALHWQQWSLSLSPLDEVAALIRDAAGAALLT